MKVLTVHPSGLMYTKIFLRLEPLGLETVAQVIRRAGHQVRIVDLQVDTQKTYFKLLSEWRPEVIAFSCNYLANVPEVINLAKATRKLLPASFIFLGGHSASFTAEELLEHGEGAIDCILRGEGESSVAQLLDAIPKDRFGNSLSQRYDPSIDSTLPYVLGALPGVVSPHGSGPPPNIVPSLDDLQPARDLLHHRSKYYIADMDPCASIEFSRGCPWDCAFCSAWTFYGRNYRLASPEKVVEDLSRIKEPNVFVVDDVAFIKPEHSLALGEAIARKGIKKTYYVETRGDVLLRNREVFAFWKKIGLSNMFIGLEAIDAEGLQRFRKRTTLSKNFEALELARSMGFLVAINIIADPGWDHERFEVVRQFCQEVPEIVNLSVFTPYPGTESWYTESRNLTTRDYRLFDIQHAVLPTCLSLEEYYRELVKTQEVVNKKFLGWKGLFYVSLILTRNLLRGQTNMFRLFLGYNKVYHHELQLADHQAEINYSMRLPPGPAESVPSERLYVHATTGRENHAGYSAIQESAAEAGDVGD
jgi:hopanoid C-3 methylase HpnR